MKKTLAKILALALCAILLVTGTVFVTLAYLNAQSSIVTNTFTSSDINITLNEARTNNLGVAEEDAGRVTENSYKLLPGYSYIKDPTVTVQANSEDCYVVIAIKDTMFAPYLTNNEGTYTSTVEGNYTVNGTDYASVYAQMAANGWIQLTGYEIKSEMTAAGADLAGWEDATLWYYYEKVTGSADNQELVIFEGFAIKTDPTTKANDPNANALPSSADFKVVAFAMQTEGYGETAETDADNVKTAWINNFGQVQGGDEG